MDIQAKLREKVQAHPRLLLFATISGAHLYGFPSPDSDFDLRGVHLLPAAEVLGLDAGLETIELSNKETMAADGMEFDIVTHDLKKFIGLMLKKNGYVLEQLLSPLVVHTSAVHEELKALSPGVITRHHAHHYLGFAETQCKLFAKENPPRVKPLLYVYRVLLTGIHLMRTGRVEANLVTLNEEFKLPYVPELIARKVGGKEQSTLDATDMAFHEGEYLRLVRGLEEARDASALPEEATARGALDDLLVRVRMGTAIHG